MEFEKQDYFTQAVEYTAFYKKLAVLISPYLDSNWSLADIACGRAEIDLELAEHVNSISAVDRDPLALAKLDALIDNLTSHHGYDGAEAKIVTLQAEAEALPDLIWDAMLFSFYMPALDKLIEIFAHARHRCILIVHEPRRGGRFDPMPEYSPLITADELDAWLKTSGHHYNRDEASMQFGQPFKSIEDIHLYIEDYIRRSVASRVGGSDRPALDSELLMLSIEDSIEKTGRHDFPYYLPNNFHVNIFIIDV
jgi:hypothetical protein